MQLRVRKDALKGHVVAGELIPPGEVLPGEYEKVPDGFEWKLEAVDPPDPDEEPEKVALEPQFQHTISAPPQPGPNEVDTEERTLGAGGGGVSAGGKAQPGANAPTEQLQRSKGEGGGASGEGGDQPQWYRDLGDKLGREPSKADLQDYADSEGIEGVDQASMRKQEMVDKINEGRF